MLKYLLYFQFFALVNALLAARFADRLAVWLEEQEADAAKRQQERSEFIQRTKAEAAERDRLRALANREMDRLARLRKAPTPLAAELLGTSIPANNTD
jgi:hypothetical protein